MRFPRATILALPFVLGLTGCGYVHVGRLPAPVTTVIGDDKLMKENSDLKLEKKILQQELALTRAQGDALRSALENRAADGDTSKKLVEKLNDTTRELATLRASYAKLQTERNDAVATAADATALKARLGATEEKLASSLRTYTELQEEVTRLRTDVDRTRAENMVLGEKVKTVTAANEQAQAALMQLNIDLLAQKDARFRAEQDADTLRTELKTAAPNASALVQQRTGAAAEARSVLAEYAAETAALKQQLDALRANVATLSAERAELKQKLSANDSARPAPADLANVEAKLSGALRDASQLRSENETLKIQLTELKSASAGAAGATPTQSLRDQLRDAQALVTALTDENKGLKTRLASGPIPSPNANPAAANSITTGAVTLTPRTGSSVNATLVATVPSAQRTAPGTKPDATSERLHVVASGDTLAKISNQYYGTPARWGDILAANREVLGETNNLVVGRTLRIP